jgi:hypothetical protein
MTGPAATSGDKKGIQTQTYPLSSLFDTKSHETCFSKFPTSQAGNKRWTNATIKMCQIDKGNLMTTPGHPFLENLVMKSNAQGGIIAVCLKWSPSPTDAIVLKEFHASTHALA